MKVLIEYPKKGNDTVKVSVNWMDLMDMDQTSLRQSAYPADIGFAWLRQPFKGVIGEDCPAVSERS